MKIIKLIFCLFLIIISFYIITDNVLTDININTINNINSKQLLKGVFNNLKENNTKDINKLFQNKNHNLTVLNTLEIKDNNDDLLIYIYNTHNKEEYQTTIYGITPKVTDVSNMIQNELLKYSIYSLVEEQDIVKEVNKRKGVYSDTYTVTRENIFKIKKQHPTIKYFFDIHRDSATGNISKIKIKNKNYARIMFVLGKGNKNYKENLKNIEKMQKYINTNYKGLLRNTYNAEYIYNQDISNNVFLVEVGGPDNTIEEIYNTSVVLSETIQYLIGENI